ncbi:cytochrome c oxidase assembly protein [Lentzea jiangxiensis]|uniref:Putative copper resistance protein D n=1 Tax=Lentzea jiangxiensis TaxID=641025 RepID=A0A1H0VQF9_9PSEU|nr:cytochrome c oxidase assembly protein [Lentzea jiangxiensis]SDP80829.1 putative copper resistance protein D [Lentzea jiangxiensis]
MRVDRTVAVASAGSALCVTVVVFWAGDVYAALGDSDPGRLTSLAFGIVRTLANAAATVAVGALAFAAFVVPAPPKRIKLTAHAYAAVRTAATAAAVWACAATCAVVLSAADASGQSAAVALDHLGGLVAATEEPKAWICSAVAAAVVAVGARATLTWTTSVLWLVPATVGVLAPVIAGHVANGAWHDVATNAMIWHIPAAAVWIGSLVALRAYLRRPGTSATDVVVRRYHRLTTWCVVVVVLSGSVAGAVLAGPIGLHSGYVVLLLLKLSVCAAVPVLRARWGVRRPLGVELVAVGLAIGASAGLTHLVPPAWFARRPSPQETVLGYELPNPPTPAELVLGWRLDLVLGLGAVVLAVVYVVAVHRLRRRGDGWPVGRTVAWLSGCAVVLVVTSSGVGRYAAGTFSMHMVAHMSLNMLAPVLLVLGGPATLALRVLPPGPRQWVAALLHCRAARLVAHPAVAATTFVGSFYVLYFSELFGAAMRFHWAHQLMNIHFLLSGYVFFWLVIGVDRAPRTLPHLARLGLLFSVMPFHAFFGVILMNHQTVIAEFFYRTLGLTWVPDLLTDQRLGGGIAWATGEIPVLVVVLALLRQWAVADRREAVRFDRATDTGHDDRLAAYNAMLAELSGRKN